MTDYLSRQIKREKVACCPLLYRSLSLFPPPASGAPPATNFCWIEMYVFPTVRALVARPPPPGCCKSFPDARTLDFPGKFSLKIALSFFHERHGRWACWQRSLQNNILRQNVREGKATAAGKLKGNKWQH